MPLQQHRPLLPMLSAAKAQTTSVRIICCFRCFLLSNLAASGRSVVKGVERTVATSATCCQSDDCFRCVSAVIARAASTCVHSGGKRSSGPCSRGQPSVPYMWPKLAQEPALGEQVGGNKRVKPRHRPHLRTMRSLGVLAAAFREGEGKSAGNGRAKLAPYPGGRSVG